MTVAAQGGNITVPSRCFFLSGPGGTGKTHLINMLLAHFRAQSQVAIATAFIGISFLAPEGWKYCSHTVQADFPCNRGNKGQAILSPILYPLSPPSPIHPLITDWLTWCVF